jgi:hypothetical protein
MQVHPYFLEKENKQLFACYYEPDQLSTKAVLLIYPIGQEYVRCHRAYHQIAITLADQGIHVLKFDFSGTGDSSANLDEIVLDDWLQDIRLAFEELVAVSGDTRPAIFAARLACLLAVKAFADTPSGRHVWLDPVLDAGAYLMSLQTQQKAILADLNRFPRSRQQDYSDGEIAGFTYAPTFLNRLASLNWQLQSSNAELVILASREHQFAGHGQQIATAVQTIDADYSWDDAEALEQMLQPGPLLQDLIELLR